MEEDKKIDIESISKLSDEELFKELKKNGLKCGPITSTTRFLYEKRLKYFLDPSLQEKEANGEQQSQPQDQAQSSEVVSSQPEVVSPQVEIIPEKVEEVVQELTSSSEVPVVTEEPSPKPSPKPIPKPSPKPAVDLSPKVSTTRNDANRSRFNESANSSPETYMNTSGIRGRAPMRRQNTENQVPTSTAEGSTNVQKKSSLTYFIVAILLAFLVYMVLIYVKDTTQHSVEF